MNNSEKRGEIMSEIARKIQESGRILPDIRNREWSKLEVPAAKLLNLLIEAENILIELDDIQMNNDQCYPEIEDMMLQLGEIRSNYINFVDNNLDILDIKIDKN